MAYLLHERKTFYTAVILYFSDQLEEEVDSNRQIQETVIRLLLIALEKELQLIRDLMREGISTKKG